MGFTTDLLGPEVYSDGDIVSPRRKGIDFIGATIVDNPETGRTAITLPAGGEGSVTDPLVLRPAKAAATAAVTRSGPQTIDGVACIAGERVFLFQQVAPAENGPWLVQAGTWTRPTDFDASAEVVSGQTISIVAGATYGGRQFMLTSTGPFTLGTTALTWSLMGGGASACAGGDLSVHYVIDPSVTNHAHSGTTAVDGTTLTAGSSRVLDTSHATAALRGIWLAQSGAWTRPADYDSDGDVAAALTADVRVTLGSTRAGYRYQQTAGTAIDGSKTFAYIPINPATVSRDGIMTALDYTHHDTVYNHVVYLKPSGDTTGATDRAAVNTALAAGHCVQLLEGVHYKDATAWDCAGRYGQWIKGMGPRVTILVDAGARGDGTGRMVNMDAAVGCEVSNLEVHMTVSDWFAYLTINPGQPTGVRFTNINIYGPSTGTIFATSSLNMTPANGSVTVTGTSAAGYPTGSRVLFVSRGSMAQQGGTVTSNGVSGTLVATIDDARNNIAATSTVSFTPGLGSKTVTGTAMSPHFANGSRVILRSRGSNASMTGLVTSSSGDLVFTCDAFTGTGAHTDWDLYGGHTDWDIRRPCRGIYASGNRIRLSHLWFSGLGKAVHFQGCFGSKAIDCWYSSGTMYETPYTGGGTSSNCRFEVGTEPSYNGWQRTIELDQTIACKIEFDTGDGGSVGGGEFIKLDGDSATDITGTLWSASGDPLIKINGSESLTVHDCFVATAGSALVDFGYGSTSLHTAIYGHKYFGGVGLGAFVGTALGGEYYLEDSNGSPHIASATIDSATLSFITTNSVAYGGASGGLINQDGFQNYGLVYDKLQQKGLVNGVNTANFYARSFVEITGPTLAFTVEKPVPVYSGQRYLMRYNGAQVWTVPHQNATNGIMCPHGVDLVKAPGVEAALLLHWDEVVSRWWAHPLCGFNVNLKLAEVDNGVSGATKTIAIANVHFQKLTMSADCVLSITDPGYNCSTEIRIIQDTTPRALTLPGSVKTPGGVGAVLSAGSGAEDIFVLERIAAATYRWTLKGAAYA